MKNYTDIEQSKKLAEILPLESADMWWPYYYDVVSDTGEYDKEPMLHKPISDTEHTIPCWSLAALLALLPLPTLEETPITDTETKWQCTIYCDKAKYWSELHDEPIDALIEAILIAKENDN